MKKLMCKKHKVQVKGIKCPMDPRCRNFEEVEVAENE